MTTPIDRCPECGRIILFRFSIHRCLAPGKFVYVRGRREVYKGSIASKPEGDYVRVRLENGPVRRFKTKNVFEGQDTPNAIRLAHITSNDTTEPQHTMNNDTMTAWNGLAKHLAQQSKEICKMNGCTDDEHRCGSYAYVSRNGLLDICQPDYFQGTSKPHAAVPLPWEGSGEDLKAEVEDQCSEMDA